MSNHSERFKILEKEMRNKLAILKSLFLNTKVDKKCSNHL